MFFFLSGRDTKGLMKNDKAFDDNLPQLNKRISDLTRDDTLTRGTCRVKRSRPAVCAHLAGAGFSRRFVL